MSSIVAGEWYEHKRSRRIYHVGRVDGDKCRVEQVNNRQRRGWVFTHDLNADNRNITEQYMNQYWQPEFPIDDWLED